ATRLLGAWDRKRFNHLVWSTIPLAGCGVFVGLSATTISLLRGEHLPVFWANDVRAILLIVTSLWSAWLAWRVTGRYTPLFGRRLISMMPVIVALGLVNFAWLLMFWIW
ncbi:MAG: 4Fe-4S binding protein, partial [Glaciimonas sp.]|nr:4Fe-4S binding protein [Glaciimonas sp.]